jgi:phospholipid transport system substrate-binding protein
MNRRHFLASAGAAALLLGASPSQAAISPDAAASFIETLGGDVIGSPPGAPLSQAERERRLRNLLEVHFDMPGISKFVLDRYWWLASGHQQAEFQKLFETLLVQSYAKAFAKCVGNKLQVTRSWPEPDGSTVVSTHIDGVWSRFIRLDWRVVGEANTMRIIDLAVEGISLRATHRSDFVSAMQTNGGTIAALLNLLRRKVSGA